VKHDIMHISLLHEYAVQFNTKDFHCGGLGKESYEKHHKKFRIWFPGVSAPLKSTVCEVMNKFQMTGSMSITTDSKHKMPFEKKHVTLEHD